MTVTEAVAIGGGFTARTKKDQMAIIRRADLDKDESSVLANALVLSGDVVKVRERFF